MKIVLDRGAFPPIRMEEKQKAENTKQIYMEFVCEKDGTMIEGEDYDK